MKKIVIKNWIKLFVFSLIIPVVTNLIIYFYSLDTSALLISITLMYYLLLATALFLAKKYNVDNRQPRSPFYFIRQFNTTGDKLYWDEYQQPLRHLVGIEIGVCNDVNAKKVVDF